MKRRVWKVVKLLLFEIGNVTVDKLWKMVLKAGGYAIIKAQTVIHQ